MPKFKPLKMNLQCFSDPEFKPESETKETKQDEKPEVKTYDEEYVKALRTESAKYRTKAKDLETSSQTQQQELMNKVFQALGLEPDAEKNFDKLLSEAQTKAQDAEHRANERILNAEVKAQASQLGVKAEKLPYLLKLADISTVEFTDGEPNQEQIKAALDAVIKDFPEIVVQANPTPPRSGVAFNQGTQTENKPKSLGDALKAFYKV
jgi:hypothetical protein